MRKPRLFVICKADEDVEKGYKRTRCQAGCGARRWLCSGVLATCFFALLLGAVFYRQGRATARATATGTRQAAVGERSWRGSTCPFPPRWFGPCSAVCLLDRDLAACAEASLRTCQEDTLALNLLCPTSDNNSLHGDIFPDTHMNYSITKLYVASGSLDTIQDGTFSRNMLAALRALVLELPQLKALSNNTFQGMKQLSDLIISDAVSLHRVDSGVLSPIRYSLEALSISGLQYCHKCDFLKNFTGTVKLMFLETLDIRFNNLNRIHNDTLKGAVSVKSIYLSHSGVRIIDSGAFSRCQSIEQLFLSWNSLTTLEAGVFSEISSLKSVWLENNPWNCSCPLKWMKSWLAKGLAWRSPLKCSYPKENSGKIFSEVKFCQINSAPPAISDPISGQLPTNISDNTSQKSTSWIFTVQNISSTLNKQTRTTPVNNDLPCLNKSTPEVSDVSKISSVNQMNTTKTLQTTLFTSTTPSLNTNNCVNSSKCFTDTLNTNNCVNSSKCFTDILNLTSVGTSNIFVSESSAKSPTGSVSTETADGSVINGIVGVDITLISIPTIQHTTAYDENAAVTHGSKLNVSQMNSGSEENVNGILRETSLPTSHNPNSEKPTLQYKTSKLSTPKITTPEMSYVYTASHFKTSGTSEIAYTTKTIHDAKTTAGSWSNIATMNSSTKTSQITTESGESIAQITLITENTIGGADLNNGSSTDSTAMTCNDISTHASKHTKFTVVGEFTTAEENEYSSEKFSPSNETEHTDITKDLDSSNNRTSTKTVITEAYTTERDYTKRNTEINSNFSYLTTTSSINATRISKFTTDEGNFSTGHASSQSPFYSSGRQNSRLPSTTNALPGTTASSTGCNTATRKSGTNDPGYSSTRAKITNNRTSSTVPSVNAAETTTRRMVSSNEHTSVMKCTVYREAKGSQANKNSVRNVTDDHLTKLHIGGSEVEFPSHAEDFYLVSEDTDEGNTVMVTLSVPESSTLVWATGDSFSQDLGCLTGISGEVTVGNLVPHLSYTFCVLLGPQKRVSPLNCLAHELGPGYEDQAWITNRGKSVAVCCLAASVLLALLAGAALMFAHVKRHPTLIKGRRVLVAKHRVADVIVLPSDYRGDAAPDAPRSRASTTSYVTVNEPTALELFAYRFEQTAGRLGSDLRQ